VRVVVMILNPRDFFLLKIAALLHDPPDKAWHVTGRLREGHEKVRDYVVKQLFGEPFVSGWFKRGDPGNRVNKADQLESAIDRWLVNVVRSATEELPPSKFGVILVNPLSGESAYPSKPEEEVPERWVNGLKGAIEALRGLKLSEPEFWRYCYHMLFALIEASYYYHYPGCAGPADTRAPHHTIFDHLYATAQIANWFSGGLEPKGFLVRLDFAGVQSFISASRKLRDLWFSSWFVSAATWYLVEEVVEYVGPDCLITPTTRWNPFYYRWLIRRLESLGYRVNEYVERVFSNFHFFASAPEREKPTWGVLRLDEPIPLVPGALLLILPDYPVLAKLIPHSDLNPGAENPAEELARYFCKRYRNFYKHLLEHIGKAIREMDECKLRGRLEEAFKELYELGGDDAPPLALRVAIVKIPDDVKSRLGQVVQRMLEEVTSEERTREEREARMRWLYCIATKELEERWKLTKTLKGGGFLAASFDKYTHDLWKQKKSYKFCTVCGGLPAILFIPRKGVAKVGEENYEEVVPEKYRAYFDEGESLCPYCLVKRLAATIALPKSLVATIAGDEELGSALLEIIKRMEKHVEGVRSTSWYAAYSFFEALCALTDEQRHRIGKMFGDHAKSVEREAKRLPDGIEKERLESGVKALQKLSEGRIPSEAEEVEGLFAAGVPSNVVRELRKIFKREVPFSAYYTLVRADGDFIGKLLAGNLREALGVDELDLLMKVVKSGPYEARELDMIYEKLRRELIKLKEAELAPIWPSYHAMISRALMLTALRDVELAKRVAKPIKQGRKTIGGSTFIIYAGGDDLLAVSAPVHALEFIRDSRRAYSEGDGFSFHTLYSEGVPVAHFPALGLASRSYALTLRHFKYPLSLALEASVLDIDERAKRARLAVGTWVKEKDALAISYVSRGGGEAIYSILPFTSVSPGIKPLEVLIRILQAFQRGYVSASFIYDLNGIVSKYDNLIRETEGLEVYYSLIRRTISRNIIIEPEKLADAVIESLCERLKPLIGAAVSVGNMQEHSILEQLSRALWALMSGFKVREV